VNKGGDLTADLNEKVAQAVKGLAASDANARRAAAKTLFALARQEHTAPRAAALGRQEVVDALGRALEDIDATVVEHAAGGMAMIFTRYFRDDRHSQALARLCKSGRALTRMWAATAAVRSGAGERWNLVGPMVADKSPEVRRQICRLIIDEAMARAISRADVAALGGLLGPAVEDGDSEVRVVARNALGALRQSL
jgi:hypothetical protein